MSWQKIDGGLAHVSVGPNGCVWGVNGDGNIYYRPNHSGSWTKVDGGLRQISVGANGHVWGVNANGEVFYRSGACVASPMGSGWTKVDGGLRYVSVGPDGRVWGVNASNEIYYRPGARGNWQKVDGGLKMVTVCHDMSVVGCNGSDDVYIREGVTADNPLGKSWKKLPDKHFQHMSASNHGMFGVQKDSDIYWKPIGKDGWKKISGGLKMIDVGCQGHVWGVNNSNEIYFLTKGEHL